MTWPIYTLITQDSNNTLWVSQFFHSSSCITITSCSITETCNSSIKLFSVILSSTLKWSTINTENKFSVATFSMSTFKWELTNLLLRDNQHSRVKTWKSGSGTLPTLKKLWSDAIDNHGKMMPVTSLTQSFCSKISSEDTLMILSRSLSKSDNTKSVCEAPKPALDASLANENI